jgi:hypothetical protein
MMRFKFLLSISYFFFIFNSAAQIQGEGEVYLKGDLIDPKFQGGGVEKFYDYVKTHFDFSKAKKPGRMVLSFAITTKGEVSDIRIVEVLDIESATEMIRVVKASPLWVPAYRNGNPTVTTIKFPFEFKAIQPTSPAQATPAQTTANSEPVVYTKNQVEKAPQYPGGLEEFYTLIAKNYQTPSVTGLSGTIIVSFIIDEAGSLTDIKVVKDLGYGTGEEAIRVLKLSPLWQPATQRGVPVRCSYSIPIKINSK